MRKADDILETYLAQIASGMPVLAPESGLDPMLGVAVQLRQVGTIEPSPASVERIRVALRRVPTGKTGAPVARPRLGLWRRPVVGLAFVVMLLALGTTSALAAPSALPDSLLYPVRNLQETVEVQLAGTPAKRALLYANFASDRMTQLRSLAHQHGLAPAVVTTLLRDIADRVKEANQEAHNDGPSARSAVREIESQIGDQLTQIQQQGEFSGDSGTQLTQTLQSVQSGQSSSNSNDNTDQP